MQHNMTTRLIQLPKGGELELQATEAFYERVRSHVGIAPDEPVTDDHIRMFIWGAVNNAVEKVESEYSL